MSGWPLARAVSRAGQLGVVSATCLDTVMVRRLQDGDPGGHTRRALAHFPSQDAVREVLDRYFLPGGRAAGQPYRRVPLPGVPLQPENERLTVMANFVEVWLAREGHGGTVGVNLLTKVQLQTLPGLYGAVLAGVHVVLMGAGIPRDVPQVLDRFAAGQAATLRLDVTGAAAPTVLTFDPASLGLEGVPLARPAFLPVVSSNVLAAMLARRGEGAVQGFVVEGPTAGGHSAPPRGDRALDERGEPRYGPKDEVDLQALAALGLPFWLAGGTGSPEALRDAWARGAAGVQVGTLFAYCEESGLRADLRDRALRGARRGELRVRTDPHASPTGFPFKVVMLPGTLADPDVYAARTRRCDLGYLRESYARPDGLVGFRCPAEPVGEYTRKGGRAEDTRGRMCLCNALLADVGLGQTQPQGPEPALLTSGDDLRSAGRWPHGQVPDSGPGQDTSGYAALDALRYLLD
ncbi:nitronate monooxygenase [Deinococcus aquiradiocola]|uniref:nitronate monooxygenase n=1 Tax=Deinococcus aquiradiocola TaxID=393059 RepID=UPI001E5C3702|nr:nitronate monooxygenase [Deinococcus aquiradiocola]